MTAPALSARAHSPRGGIAYRPELDGLRGVAILLVVFTHLYLPNTDAFGWMGVEVFFVLSGFLITSLLVAEHDASGRIDLRDFYVRRVRRLAPALLVLIALVTAFQIAVVRQEGLYKAGWVLAYLANWRIAAGGYLAGLGHTWSLSIEEQFYLVWPIVLLVALRLGGWRLALGVAATIGIASLAWRLGLSLSTGDEHGAYYRTDTRLDGLMAGGALALLAPRWVPGRATAAIAAIAIGAVCLVPVWGHAPFLLGPGLGTVVVGTGVLMFVRGGPLTFGPLVAIGRLSYSLYLWHYPIMYGARQLFGYVPIWTIPLAFAAAWLSYRFVERPFRARSATAEVGSMRPVRSATELSEDVPALVAAGVPSGAALAAAAAAADPASLAPAAAPASVVPKAASSAAPSSAAPSSAAVPSWAAPAVAPASAVRSTPRIRSRGAVARARARAR